MAEIAPSDDQFNRTRLIVPLWSLSTGLFLAGGIGSLRFSAFAATNQSPADEIPPLRPPRDVIPPSYWQEHSTAISLVIVIAIVAICALLWFLLRHKPAAIVPPEIEARRALEALRRQREIGALLSRVSQILRRYLAAAFDLPPGEMTTTEFCAMLTGNPLVGDELSGSLTEFLRGCDEQKFSPSPPPATQSAVEQALRLVWLGQTRVQELRQAENAQSSGELAATKP